MKNKKNHAKKIMNGLLIALLAVGLTSCNNNKKPEDTKEVAEEHNDAKFDNSAEKDAQFVVNAAEINLMEIDLGQLASTNSSMDEVKKMGKMMVDEHTKALEELKALAQKKNITIPTSATDDAKDKYKKLSEKTGMNFDKDYCDMMVDGHKDAIDKFEKAANDANDADVKAWAASTLPTLRAHLDHALTCQANCKKM